MPWSLARPRGSLPKTGAARFCSETSLSRESACASARPFPPSSPHPVLHGLGAEAGSAWGAAPHSRPSLQPGSALCGLLPRLLTAHTLPGPGSGFSPQGRFWHLAEL